MAGAGEAGTLEAFAPPVLMGGLVAWHGLFNRAELDALERHCDALEIADAELATAGPQTIRNTRVGWVDRNAHTETAYRRLEEAVLNLNAQFFRFDLSAMLPFQYAVYDANAGGYFDWHKDYGRDARDPVQEPRKITLSLQLSDCDAYEGCDLQVRAGNAIDIAPRARGTLVAFPANVLHRVTPIARGTRKSLVAWATGPEFR